MKPKNHKQFNIRIFNSKKGDIFIIALVVITLLAFTTLAYYIQINKSARAEISPIGLQALSLTNLYKEIQNEKFYIESSAKLSQSETLNILGENAGYSKENSCKKTKEEIGREALIIFNADCPEFDPESSYKSQLELQLKSYLQKYKSLYPNQINEKYLKEISDYFNSRFEIINATKVIQTAENNTQSLEIEENKINSELNTIQFKSKKYLIEYSTNDSFYEYNLSISMQNPNIALKQFNNLYTALKSCKEDIKNCNTIIKTIFANAEVKSKPEYPGYLYINTKTNPEIKLLFNETSELPKYSPKAAFKSV